MTNYRKFMLLLFAVPFMWGCGQQDSDQEETEHGNIQDQAQNEAPEGINQLQQEPEDVSDEELQLFSQAANQIQALTQQAQVTMVKAVEDEGITVDRFNEIQQAQQNPNQETNATEEELKTFQSAMQGIQKIQKNAQEKMLATIIDQGLTEERYQQISAAIQNDTALMAKFRAMQAPQSQPPGQAPN